MAVNDVVTAHSSVADTASLTIQPGTGAEWLIKNIYFGGAVELYRTDGTNAIKIDADPSAGRLSGSWLLTNGVYLALKNVSGGAAYLGYDGMVTK